MTASGPSMSTSERSMTASELLMSASERSMACFGEFPPKRR